LTAKINSWPKRKLSYSSTKSTYNKSNITKIKTPENIITNQNKTDAPVASIFSHVTKMSTKMMTKTATKFRKHSL